MYSSGAFAFINALPFLRFRESKKNTHSNSLKISLNVQNPRFAESDIHQYTDKRIKYSVQVHKSLNMSL